MKFVERFQTGCRCVMFFCMTWSFASANAAVLYAQEGGRLYGLNNFSNLVEIDLDNQQITEIGDIGFGLNGLTFHPPTGELFGISPTGGGRRLVRVDPTTGQGTAVGSTGFDNGGEIAYNPSTGGFYSTISDGIGGPTSLIQIDAETGAGEIIGETGFLGFLGLAYDQQDNLLFGTASPMENPADDILVSLDPLTGTATAIGPVDLGAGLTPFGLTHDPFSDQLVVSLPGFLSPTLFFTSNQFIYGIDKQTGEISSFTRFTPNESINALAFVPNAIPEPGSGCVLMLGLTAAFLSRRRR